MTMANLNNAALFNNEMMSEEQLGAVSGGTIGELKELVNAFFAKDEPLARNIGKVETHVPGANRFVANGIKNLLKDNLHIDADISLGFLGTGAGSKNNTYKDMTTGNSISHQEVLNRIKEVC